MECNILLSIIIPVYNGEKYLDTCLKSIFNVKVKSGFNFEAIIVDDGSTDNTAEIIQQYTKKFNNIKIITNSNHGVSYSRNCGIEEASGKYLMFVDCDDLLDSEWQSSVYSKLTLDYDFVFFSKYFHNQQDNNFLKSKLVSYILTYNSENIRISGPYSKLFKRDFIISNNIRFKNEIINGEDTLFNIEAVLKAKTYLLVKDSFYIVRHNQYSSTRNFNEKIIKSEIAFNNEMLSLLKDIDYIDYNQIKEHSFLISIRSLAYKLSYINRYLRAKKYYIKVHNEEFFLSGFSNITIHESVRSKLLYFLFKYKFYLLLYFICKLKSMKLKEDFYELL